jgi:hypothetical protein
MARATGRRDIQAVVEGRADPAERLITPQDERIV